MPPISEQVRNCAAVCHMPEETVMRILLSALSAASHKNYSSDEASKVEVMGEHYRIRAGAGHVEWDNGSFFVCIPKDQSPANQSQTPNEFKIEIPVTLVKAEGRNHIQVVLPWAHEWEESN